MSGWTSDIAEGLASAHALVYRRVVMGTSRHPGRATGAVMCLALTWTALACSDAHGNQPAQEPVMDASTVRDAGRDAAVSMKERTVTIELFKTGERVIEMGAGGELVYGPLIDIGGVEVCVVQRRAAFRSFEPFEDIEPICETSVEGGKITLQSVPANSDLILSATKPGYMPGSSTFRTDAFDVDLPDWGPSIVTVMLREGALEPWLEPAPIAEAAGGGAAVWANALWTGAASVIGEPFFGSEPLPNLTPAEGVRVEIERYGRPVTELATLRERPRFVALPAGLYSLRFTHPRMNGQPIGAGQQYLVTGIGTERQDTIELPVLAGHFTAGVVLALCAAADWNQPVEDLATCTLAPADAGSP